MDRREMTNKRMKLIGIHWQTRASMQMSVVCVEWRIAPEAVVNLLFQK